MSVCASLRIPTITPVVGGQASVTSAWVDWAGVRCCIPLSTYPFCFLLSMGGIERERKKERKRETETETVREGLFVPVQEQSGLEARWAARPTA